MKPILFTLSIFVLFGAFLFNFIIAQQSNAQIAEVQLRLSQQERLIHVQRQSISDLNKKLAAVSSEENISTGKVEFAHGQSNAEVQDTLARILKIVASQSQKLRKLKYELQDQNDTSSFAQTSDIIEVESAPTLESLEQLSQENNERIQLWKTSVLEQFEVEPFDGSWAAERNAEIQTSLDTLISEMGGNGESVQDVSCKKSMCKVVMYVGKESAAMEMMKMELTASLAGTFSRSTTISDPVSDGEGMQTYVFWN